MWTSAPEAGMTTWTYSTTTYSWSELYAYAIREANRMRREAARKAGIV